MKICKRALNFVQIYNDAGDVRVCGWLKGGGCIGNIIEQDIPSIMHGEKAAAIWGPMFEGDYSICQIDDCPLKANGTIEENSIEIDEIPDYPESIYLAYEGKCNYACTCCSSSGHMRDARENNYTENYKIINERIKDILPHVKQISAHGTGELFVSPYVLEVLSSWEPSCPVEEASVALETNGSLFDEKHWKKIENLGQYNLGVTITVMSFDEITYQYLSGCSYPISKIEDNLRFVKSLREKGIINRLTLSTVVQEANFREMPEFTRRCLEEFGADYVRMRCIVKYGSPQTKNICWFMDPRNPEHPYYGMYCKVFEHPIFKDPRVLMWSGGLPSLQGACPGDKDGWVKNKAFSLLSGGADSKRLVEICKDKKVAVYGLGVLGKLLLSEYADRINFVGAIDNSPRETGCYKGVNCTKAKDWNGEADLVIVTLYDGYDKIREELIASGFGGEIFCMAQPCQCL